MSPHGCYMDSGALIPTAPSVTHRHSHQYLEEPWSMADMEHEELPRPKPSAGRKDGTELQKLNRVLRKNEFLPTKCPQWCPSGSSGPRAHHEPHPHPVLTQAGSLHTLYHELMCQPGPPTSFEGCSGNEAGMDGSPIRLRRCLGAGSA